VSLNEKTFQTFSASKPMSALPPKTGFRATHRHVRLGPKPEVAHGGIGVGRGDCERVAISRAISCLIFAD